MTVADVEHALTRKLGAARDPSGHHVFFYYADGTSEYTVAKLSHSWRGHLNDTQVQMLAKKLYLAKREFEDFVDCSLATNRLLQVWRERRAR